MLTKQPVAGQVADEDDEVVTLEVGEVVDEDVDELEDVVAVEEESA